MIISFQKGMVPSGGHSICIAWVGAWISTHSGSPALDLDIDHSDDDDVEQSGRPLRRHPILVLESLYFVYHISRPSSAHAFSPTCSGRAARNILLASRSLCLHRHTKH